MRGILSKMIQQRSRDPYNDFWYREWAGLKYQTSQIAGVNLDEASSLCVVAVYACVNLIASDIATLPLPVYQSNRPQGKKRAENHQLYHILHDEPNSEQTSGIWRMMMMTHILLWGNGYSEIEFGTDGQPKALWPLPAWRVKPRRTDKRDLYYEIGISNMGIFDSTIEGSVNPRSFYGETENIPPYAMFHIPALSITGISGLSPIRQAMAAVGLSRAAEEMGARLFGQGANMGGIVEHPGELGKETAERLEESLNRNYRGLGKAHRIMLLEEGMKWHKAGLAPEEAQFLETRSFQRGEIASLFRVPPHMIGDTEKSTSWGKGIEQQSIGYVQHTLRPWLVFWEQEIKRKLFRRDQNHFAEFVVDGLLRGDIKSRYQAYKIGREGGWLNADQIRELENMNPMPNGEGQTYLVPMNMEPTSQSENDDIIQSLEEAIRRVALREKENLLRAADREGDKFDIWIDEFYRDFDNWIEQQFQLVLGEKSAEFTERYIENSREALEGITADEMENELEDWEDQKVEALM